jgi:hypothetical protein
MTTPVSCKTLEKLKKAIAGWTKARSIAYDLVVVVPGGSDV